jgi:cytochrome c peroxidase
MSCATCHNPSFDWGDGQAKAVGDGMKQLGRRSPTILNSAWIEPFMWDGRFESLEEQALGPITSPDEMNMPLEDLVPKLEKIEEYPQLFASAFDGSTEITPDKIARAIATFERTVVSGEAPFDRWARGDESAISPEAKRGFELFNGKANCSACHEGWRFTDDSFHDIGLPDGDLGRGMMLPNIEKMQHAFKTPSLRNIDRRGPYMHDGSLADLVTVIHYYDSAENARPSRSDEIRPLRLSKEEKQDLVAFLETLTSDDPPVALPVMPR